MHMNDHFKYRFQFRKKLLSTPFKIIFLGICYLLFHLELLYFDLQYLGGTANQNISLSSYFWVYRYIFPRHVQIFWV